MKSRRLLSGYSACPISRKTTAHTNARWTWQPLMILASEGGGGIPRASWLERLATSESSGLVWRWASTVEGQGALIPCIGLQLPNMCAYVGIHPYTRTHTHTHTHLHMCATDTDTHAHNEKTKISSWEDEITNFIKSPPFRTCPFCGYAFKWEGCTGVYARYVGLEKNTPVNVWVVSWTNPFLHKIPFVWKKNGRQTNDGCLDWGIWKTFSCGWTERGCRFKGNNRQYLLSLRKLTFSSLLGFGKFVCILYQSWSSQERETT